jgi:peptidoglycan/LPS O-acetylase OafA/YrhL
MYLIMPFLIHVMRRLSQRQLIATLVAMPFISLIPSTVWASMMASGVTWDMTTELFFAHFPLFWVPHFVAGMLMTRIFSLHKSRPMQFQPSMFSWGYIAFVLVILIALTPDIRQPI